MLVSLQQQQILNKVHAHTFKSINNIQNRRQHMSTDFFSKLGQELVSIRNSPFYKLGQVPKTNSDGLIRSELSYDPNRLFNVEKYQEMKRGIEDKDLLQSIRQEEKEADKVEFQMLKNTTLADYEQRINDLNREMQRGNSHLTPSPFKTNRTLCLACNRCTMFRGNFKPTPVYQRGNPANKVAFLSCLHCSCQMSAHAPAKAMPYHRSYIWKHLKTAELQQEHLDFQCLILAFRVKEANDDVIWKLRQLLERMGFKVENDLIVNRSTFELKMLRCALLASGQQSGVLQGMLQLAECIHNSGGWHKQMKVGQQFREHFNILKKLSATVKSRSLENVQEDDNIAVILIRHDQYSPSPNELKLALKQIHQHLHSASLIHVSQSRKDALFEVQQLFPCYFLLHKRMFLLARTEKPEQNLWKFQDMLDYNQYSSFIQGIKDIQRVNLEKILEFMPYHEITYLLGRNLANQRINNFGLFYSVKTGPENLKYQGQLPQFLQIRNKSQIERVINSLLPSYLLGQRCLIVIRPLVTRYAETVVNLLRLNKFVVIQRRKQRISLEEAHFISFLEHISQEEREQYIEMMTAGSVELILVSKRGALFEANSLLNSNLRGMSHVNTHWLSEQPSFEMQKGRQILKQELNMHYPSLKQIFRTGGDLISLESCLLGTQGRKNVLENCKTGELIIVEGGKTKGQFKGTSRQREQIFKGLRQDPFNYILFTSKSDKTTEQLASIFFPESTRFESVVVLIKPAYHHLLDRLKQLLSQYRYHIIFHKSIVFSKLLTFELLSPLQKISIGGESFDEVVESFVGNRVSMLCVSKIGATKQMLAMLSAFSFLPARTVVDESDGDKLIQEALIPVWNNEETFLKLFNRHLGSLEDSVHLVTSEGQGALKPEQKMELYEYFIGSLLGVRPTDALLNTSLGRLTLYSTNQTTATYQSWYYATMSQLASAHIPLLFQHRTYSQETLAIQIYPGEPFMSAIISQYTEEMLLHKERAERREDSSDRKKKKQRSLVLLLWAKKIFQMVERLSGLDGGKMPEIQVEGWGSLMFKNGQHCGQYTSKDIHSAQKAFLQEMLVKHEANRPISANIKKMLTSRIFPQRYKPQDRRLLPIHRELSLEESLRIIQTGLVNRLYLQDQFQMLDPDNEKQLIGHDELLSLKLYRTDPLLASKYRLLAQILLFFQKWKEESAEHREVFTQMLEHLRSMLTKYDDVEYIQYEVYLQTLRQVDQGQLPPEMLRNYPSLRKNKLKTMLDIDQPGKNRKYLEQKSYFKPFSYHNERQQEQINNKYGHFNLKTLEQPIQHHILNREDDPLHKQWATQENFISLLRNNQEGKEMAYEHKGVYVEYEKKLNEKEENLKQKIEEQIGRLDLQEDGGILRDNGLDPDIYYKKAKGQVSTLKVSNKLDSAIAKQLQKLTMFKTGEGFGKTQ